MHDWLEADWPAADFIKAGTTFRQGGVSQSPYTSLNLATHVGDKLEDVNKNRLQLVLPNTTQWLEQTHSLVAVSLPNTETIPKADASYTDKNQVVCSVLTADCLPLLVTDKKGRNVAAIHAGWRGLCEGIIENTLKQLPFATQDCLVWLGPAISVEVYEVGQDVYDAFCAVEVSAKSSFTKTREGHWLFDIYALAKQRLNNIGVKNIYGGHHCSYTEEEHFFSYRRDGTTGRMASMIWIDK
ncbi:MAG: peptidoglycan editing factor PgeF [Woeseiaceae bacterium]